MPISINGSGTITGISAGGLPDGVITSADLASGAITSAGLPAGSILQVVSTIKTDAEVITVSGVTYSDISDLSITVTPVAASSEILITGYVNGLCSGGNQASIHLLRGSTEIGQGDAASNRRRSHSLLNGNLDTGSQTSWTQVSTPIHFLDTPTYTLGDSITYKIQVAQVGTVWINRSDRDNDANTWDFRTASNLTVTEVAA